MIFPKDKVGGILTWILWGMPCVRGKPSKLSTTHSCLFSQPLISARILVKELLPGNGKSVGKNSNWEEHPFLKDVFRIHGQENAQKMHASFEEGKKRFFFSPLTFWGKRSRISSLGIHISRGSSHSGISYVYASRFQCFLLAACLEIHFGVTERMISKELRFLVNFVACCVCLGFCWFELVGNGRGV